MRSWYVSLITRVPMPTKLRIDRWTFNFMEVLNDQRGRKEFLQFLEKEFSGKLFFLSDALGLIY